jgi:glycosyltransferase involved in cell wall biosynthesis
MLKTGAPTFHVIGLHHTIASDEFSACAFTGKVLRLPDVLHAAYPDQLLAIVPDDDENMKGRSGCRVIEYGNEGSESNADEHVVVRSLREFVDGFKSVEDAARDYAKNCTNAQSIAEYDEALRVELRRRVAPGDFILHPFCGIHKGLLERFPQCIHVESGIGYVAGGFGAYRIFESEAWRNWHAGRMVNSECAGAVGCGGPGDLANQFVCPNYYDPEYWTFGAAPQEDDKDREPYVLFAGRPDTTKGIGVVAEVARRMPHVKFKIAGTPGPLLHSLFGRDRSECDNPDCCEGDCECDDWLTPAPNVELLGVVQGRARVPLYGGALCMIMPTAYFEPFGGSCVEAMMTGTPVLAPPVGCFAERPVIPAVKVEDYVGQIGALLQLQQDTNGRVAYYSARQTARQFAIDCYSIEAAAAAYRLAFESLRGRP